MTRPRQNEEDLPTPAVRLSQAKVQNKNYKKSKSIEQKLSNKRDLEQNVSSEYNYSLLAFSSLQLAEQKTVVSVPITTRGIDLLIAKLTTKR